MLCDFRLEYADYRGARSETHIYLDINEGEASLVDTANALANIITPLSTAFLVGGDVTFKTFYDISIPPDISSNVDRRLLVLCRDGDDIASFVLPSPKALPVVGAGPQRFYLVQDSAWSADPGLSALVALLRRSNTRFNQPFPSGGMVKGAYMLNEL